MSISRTDPFSTAICQYQEPTRFDPFSTAICQYQEPTRFRQQYVNIKNRPVLSRFRQQYVNIKNRPVFDSNMSISRTDPFSTAICQYQEPTRFTFSTAICQYQEPTRFWGANLRKIPNHEKEYFPLTDQVI